ncbi:MAG: SiaB family protein kinase [Bacteroidota bacterium]|nr:SiaB family protein kinase [Bacteroidota bacterium]
MDKTDIQFTGALLRLYEDFEDKGISLIYLGRFSHKIIKMFSALTEEETERHGEPGRIRRRLNHSVIEILQNLTKHSASLFNEINISKGMFILGKDAKAYYVITANKVNNEDIPMLTDAIDTVNNAAIEKLNKMYKYQLREGRLSHKGGAGLGLIDIARKTNKPIQYHFLPLDDNRQYFVLKVSIDSAGNDRMA